jgi:hypothetical protein
MQVEIRDASDLKALAKQLREVEDGKALRKELTSGIRAVLRPLVPQVRAAYRANPRHRGGRSRDRAQHGDLRDLLAKATRIEVALATRSRAKGQEAGARIRVDGRRMPDGMKALPAYYEGEKPRWRAPLFGDRDRWFQYQSRPTFYRVVTPHTDEAGRAIDKVLDDVRKKLERGP